MDAARRRHDPARLTRALDEQDQRDILDGALAMLGVQPDQPYVDTPGCTTQACGVRDHRPYDEAADAVVLGVSPDPVDRVKRFHDRHGLGFTLLADADHAVCERYGVWVEKSMYGKTHWGAERSTFVIGADGKVERVLRNVGPTEHDELVLAALGAAAG